MNKIRETEAFKAWFANLRDTRVRTRIDVRIKRLALGNPGDIGPVGEGISELRIHYGPGTGFITRRPAGRLWFCSAVGINPRRKRT